MRVNAQAVHRNVWKAGAKSSEPRQAFLPIPDRRGDVHAEHLTRLEWRLEDHLERKPVFGASVHELVIYSRSDAPPRLK